MEPLGIVQIRGAKPGRVGRIPDDQRAGIYEIGETLAIG